MATFFTADLHFNHAAIIGLCNRPFTTVEAMNAAIERNWNGVVRPKDTIYVLGDFGFSNTTLEPLSAIFGRLNGHKHLVIGNHDEQNPKVTKLGWESMNHLLTVKSGGMRAECCHYPLETWKRAGFAIMLHGHSHGNLKRQIAHRFDVGFDAPGGQIPFLFEDLWTSSRMQTFEPMDHHGDM